MTFCSLLTWLLLAAILLAAMPFTADRIFPKGRLTPAFCRRLCRWWVLLALLAGLALGGLLFCCRAELLAWIGDSWCRRALLFGLLLLLALLYLYLRQIGRCGWDSTPAGGRLVGLRATWGGTLAFPVLLVLLLLVLLVLVRRCCADSARAGEPGWTLCHTLLALLLVLLLVVALLKFLEARFCEDSKPENCRERLLLYARLLLVTILLLVVLVLVCCGELTDRDYDLAMVGIWWQGDHSGEAGAHLRWSFRHGLSFPENGFDLQRRPSAGGAWTTLNSQRIFPADEWGDETAVSGDMAIPDAVERIHPDVWARYRGSNFDDLVAMVGEPPYATLIYVEEPVAFAAPSNPYTSQAAADAYLAGYHASTPDEEPALGTWSIEPMTLLMTSSLHSDIARLLGLYWIDLDAPPATEHDYRIVGYWTDRTRRYTVKRLSKPRTDALSTPALFRWETPVVVSNVGGVTAIDDRAVGLAWEPPPSSVDPDALFGPIDRIDSILFTLESMPVTESGTDSDGRPLCPPAVVEPPAFAPLTRTLAGVSEQVAPIAVSPVEDEATSDLSWPRHYFVDRDLEYGCRAYRVLGRDLFGRPAPPSSERVARVLDFTGPPPPAFVTATAYQDADVSLAPDLRTQFFPSGSTNTFALHVTWAWTDEQAARAPDLAEFRIFEQHTDYVSFPKTVDWRLAASWETVLDTVAATASTSAIDPATLLTGRLYERTFTDADTSLAALGLDGDDTTPVKLAWIGVAGVDHDPYGNVGAVSAPVSIVGRDLTPPAAPDPPPALSGPIPAADERGNRTVPLRWTGNPLWTYELFRVDSSDLAPLLADPASADLGACAAVVVPPGCNPSTDGPDCQEAHEDHRIRATAVVRLAAFGRVSATPIGIESTTADTGDVVDATVSSKKVYATKAVDRAGNVGPLSCPSAVVLVEDGIAPRPPVIVEALAGDGSIALRWSENLEGDLARYTVYRTDAEGDATSRRAMTVLALLGSDGSVVTGPSPATRSGTPPYRVLTWTDSTPTPGRRYFYAVDAIDLALNRSSPSNPVSASTFDATAPDPPVWGAVTVDGAGSEVSLAWSGEPDATFLLQRRDDGRGMWRSVGGEGWVAGTSRVDSAVATGRAYEYRVRAMDQSGNRGEWSAVQTITVP